MPWRRTTSPSSPPSRQAEESLQKLQVAPETQAAPLSPDDGDAPLLAALGIRTPVLRDRWGGALPDGALGYVCERDARETPQPLVLGRRGADGRLWVDREGSRSHLLLGRALSFDMAEANLRLSGLVGDAAFVLRPGDSDVAGHGAEQAFDLLWVPAEGGLPDEQAAAAIRRQLARQLDLAEGPDEALLALYRVDAIVRDREGIADREASLASARAVAPYVAPATASEQAIHALWCELLEREPISVTASFMSLGGNSIAMMRIATRINTQFAIQLELDAFFRWPTIRELAQHVDALLAQAAPASEARPEDGGAPRPLTAEEEAQGLPASFAERRFWFLHQLQQGEDTFNNLSESVRLTGAVDIAALRAALDALAAQQDVLRTSFDMVEGEVLRRVQPARGGELPLQLMAADDIAGDIDAYIQDWIRRPFDLAQAPLARVCLIREDDDHHRFVLAIHHSIADGWSIGILIDSLLAAYAAAQEGRPSALPEPELRYGAFAAWQRAQLDDAQRARLLDFWRPELEGLEELELPTDFQRPALQSYRGRKHSFAIAPEISGEVERLAAQYGVTGFTFYLAAWAALLQRYSHQDDIAVGAPMGARPLAGLERTAGCFLNTLVYRVDLSGDPDLETLLRRVDERVQRAFRHQALPFEILVDELGVARDMGRHPLVQTMLLFQNEPAPLADPAGLAVQRLLADNHAALTDLTLSLELRTAGVSGVLEYATDLFRPETARQLATHYVRLLEQLCRAPRRALSEHELLDEAERRLQLVELNDTARALPTPHYIHQLMQAQALRHPDRVALVSQGATMRYAELEARSNRVAHALIANGCRPRDFVAICLERGFAMIAALYGVLKAGAAYVPLDPAAPEARVRDMLEDSQARLLLSTPAALARFADADWLRDSACTQLYLADDGEDLSRDYPDSDPGIAVAPSDPAYMIYTSGSTGRPKGVVNSHHAIRNRIQWIREIDLIPSDAVQMQKTPYTFDVSLGEIFGAPTVGARLVIAEPEGHKDVDYLIDLIAAEGVTHVHFVPSMLRPFIYHPRVGEVATLRQICCTGEPLAPALVERVRDCFPEIELFNLYGPTEAAVEVSAWDCRQTRDDGLIPIGRPIINTQLYVLDEELRPLPRGVIGELYIGGDNLATGYHRRPELTAAAFIPNPFEAGSRLYRTGDRARLLASGDIDFLGRIDGQVKIRGNRIELGEIAAIIGAQPGIRDVHVAVSREEMPRIIAYVVPAAACDEAESSALTAALREAIAAQLSDYMMPSFFVLLEALPQLSNGKLDAKRLPQPALEAQRSARYVAVSGEIPLALHAMWSQLLQVERIGMDDQFFEIGGHSLLLIQLSSQIQAQLGVKLAVVELFRYPTIRSLAARIERALDGADEEARRAAEAARLSREEASSRAAMAARQRQQRRLRTLRAGQRQPAHSSIREEA